MNADFIPPTLNVREVDPACNLDLVVGASRQHTGHTVLANAFGFGGNNASVLLRTVN
jgi:3-oxoacyl-[acyl-carrier-protein] synthase II